MGLDHQESENRGDKRYEDGDIEKHLPAPEAPDSSHDIRPPAGSHESNNLPTMATAYSSSPKHFTWLYSPSAGELPASCRNTGPHYPSIKPRLQRPQEAPANPNDVLGTGFWWAPVTPDPGSPWCLPTPVAPGDYHSRAPCRVPGTQSPILLPYVLAPVARSSSYDTRPLAVSPWFLPTPVAPSTSQGPRQLLQKAPSRLSGIQAPVSTQHLPSPPAPGGLPGRVPCRLLGTQAPVSPWHLPAPMAPGSSCGPNLPTGSHKFSSPVHPGA
ncbi:uncharacterized protein LOC132481533 [Mesoplodon densirostris]|uniref:uncharacterized protein LOC132481533 n=1 Tax=Mesoplodon densirostris TaxID=48708 RepID=UPI0028DC8052|nr:uncharacterized protein LOC132481533 [Mesoplodon densirostris]